MAEKLMKQKVKKTTKKTFFEIEAPITATKIHLYAPDQESLEGKTAKLDLTKNLRGKNLELILKIKLEDNKLVGYPVKTELLSSYIKRVMRKSADYCEDSFQTESKDAAVAFKPFLITRKRVSRTILKLLRENTRKFLESHAKTRSSHELFTEIITNKLQKQLSLKLKKIYPLALCEIRIFEIIKPLDKKDLKEEKSPTKKPSKEKSEEEN